MAAPQKEKQVTPEEQEAARIAYEGFFEEALRDPVKFIKHDTSAHDDEKLYRVVNAHGMAWYGWYWLLVELLASRKGKSYDVSDDAGWRRLARDMCCLCDMDVDECKSFIQELAIYGLVQPEQLTTLKRVQITRLSVDSMTYAEEVAAKRLGAWKTNRRRILS